jgi:GNAT superfamily N-acetyltransferase
MADAIDTRPATIDDVDEMMAIVRLGIESYADFAPAGWSPPPVPDERERNLARLADPRTWALLAIDDDGRAIGHFAFTPATERNAGETPKQSRDRPLVAGMAHLWQLFVRPEWWGQGVAAQLHQAGITEMRGQGYERARLFTPSAHARARRFYERRGWVAVDERFNPDLALQLNEYRLELSSAGGNVRG